MMGKTVPSLLAAYILIIGSLCQGQSSVKVSDPRLEFRNNMLLISYDIIESDPEEKYVISVDIRDEDGDQLDAKSLAGDLGMVEEGGDNKQITWNLAADNVFIDAQIYIQINAEVIPPIKSIVEELPEEVPSEAINQEVSQSFEQQEDSQKEINKQAIDAIVKLEAKEPVQSSTLNVPPAETTSRSFNRAGIVMQSLAMPGLGLSRVTGQPHWLRAVAGYGLIAGSVAMNRMAITTFNGIEDLVQFDDIDEAYNKSSRQNNTSEMLAYGAIGIWVADFIWTIAGTSDLNRRNSYHPSNGISLRGTLDPITIGPMLLIQYRF